MRLALLLALSAFTMSAADAAKPLPWEKNHIQVGLSLFRANCAVCHDVDRTPAESKKMGPSFYHLFQSDKFPMSGDKLTRAAIADKIKNGGIIMPAFGDKLNASEINTLIDFLQTK